MSAISFNPTITTAGEAAAINSSNNGVELAITHVSFGTGAYTPNGTEVALATEVYRTTIVAGTLVTPNQCRISAVWSSETDNFPVNEVGFWANDVLFAVWSREVGGPLGYKTPGVDFVLFNDLKFTSLPPNSITIVVDEGSGSAALAALVAHEGAADPHPGYLRKAGFPDAQSFLWCGVAGGTASALTLTLPVGVTAASYVAGQSFRFKAQFTNTGAVTANVASLGGKTILKNGGAPLSSGDIQAGQVVEIVYDGLNFNRIGGEPTAAGKSLAYAIALG